MIKQLTVLLLLTSVCLANDSYYYKGVIAVATTVSDGSNPTPPGPPTPPNPDDDKCPDCDGLGYIGDGRIRVKCNACDGTGKRKKTEGFSLFEPQPYIRQAFAPARERSTLPLQETGSETHPPAAPSMLLAEVEEGATFEEALSLRVILLSEPSWCRFCVTAEKGLEYLQSLSPTWKVGSGPENHFQVIDSTKGREAKAQADEYRRKANKWLADNDRFDEQTTAVPIFITINNDEVIGVHIGWFDGIKPETDEAAWKLAGLLGVSKEHPKGVHTVQAEPSEPTEEEGKRRDRKREEAELEFVQKAKTPSLDMRALIEKWGPGGKIVLNENATLRPSKDVKFLISNKSDSTYLNVVSGSLTLDYTWGLFRGSLEVPHLRVQNDLSVVYLGLKGPLPDFPIELHW